MASGSYRKKESSGQKENRRKPVGVGNVNDRAVHSAWLAKI